MSIFDDDEGGVDAVVVAAADADVVSDAEADVDDWRRVREMRAEGLFVREELIMNSAWKKEGTQQLIFGASNVLKSTCMALDAPNIRCGTTPFFTFR